MGKRIIVALDGMSEEKAIEIAEMLKGEVWGFKVNDLLDTMGPRQCLRTFRRYGHVMADPKLCDIPNTMSNRSRAYFGDYEERAQGLVIAPDILTIMACAGIDGMRAVVEQRNEFFSYTKIAAVTVLTSISEEECNLIFGGPVKSKVLEFARTALIAGCDALVCSPQELVFLNQFPELQRLTKITPGIRPEGVSAQDQKRINTPYQAILNGADLLVIGRAITQAKNPLEAVQTINEEIAEAGIEK